MFTNNYIAFRHNMFIGCPGYSTALQEGAVEIRGKSYVNCVGATVWNMTAHGSLMYVDIPRCLYASCKALDTDGYANGYGGVVGTYFGSGTTPATKDDYTLESLIASGLGVADGQYHIEDEGTGKYSVSKDFVLTNITEENIIISEIGCFGSVPESSSKWHQVLWERTVLSSPIIIAPGESKLITYKITFNQPQ